MPKLKNSFDYNFEGELLYAKKGDMVQAKKISIKAPTNSNIIETIKLQQEYEKSQLKMASSLKDFVGQAQVDKMLESNKGNKTKDKEEEPTTTIIIQQLMAGGDVEKCFDALKKILLSSHRNNAIAMIDDIEPMTETIYDDMAFVDTKNILGLYILNFMAISQGR